MKTVCIEVAKHENPCEDFNRAMKCDPQKIVFIGNAPELNGWPKNPVI